MNVVKCVSCGNDSVRGLKFGRPVGMVDWSVKGKPVCSTSCAGKEMERVLHPDKDAKEVAEWLRANEALPPDPLGR